MYTFHNRKKSIHNCEIIVKTVDLYCETVKIKLLKLIYVSPKKDLHIRKCFTHKKHFIIILYRRMRKLLVPKGGMHYEDIN